MVGDEDARADIHARKQSMKRLAELLSQAVEHGPVELLATWAGEEEKEPVERSEVTPVHFTRHWREAPEPQFFIVRKEV